MLQQQILQLASGDTAPRENLKPPPLFQLEINIDRIAACSTHSLRNRGNLDHLAGRFEDRLIHDRIAARLGETEIADRAIPLNGDLERGGEVMLVLGRDGGRLLPLTEEAVVNEGLVSIDRARIGPIAACPTCTCSSSL